MGYSQTYQLLTTPIKIEQLLKNKVVYVFQKLRFSKDFINKTGSPSLTFFKEKKYSQVVDFCVIVKSFELTWNFHNAFFLSPKIRKMQDTGPVCLGHSIS